MIYAELSTAIERIVTEDDCTTDQMTKLKALSEDVGKMSPNIKASSDMVTEVMKVAGYMG